MEKDQFWRIRRAALSVIANIYSPDPQPGETRAAAKLDEPVLQAVIRMTKDQNSLTRGDAFELLGETLDPKHADLLIAALDDQSYFVIDQAALALGRVKGPKAADALAKLTVGTTWRNRVESAGLRGLAELGDKKAFDPAFKIANDKTRPAEVRTAALAVVGATGKGDPRAFPLVFERFKASLEAQDFEDVTRGLEAIIQLGDPRGQQAFDLMRQKFKDDPALLAGVKFYEDQFKAALKK
jgi:aminopeptidase N